MTSTSVKIGWPISGRMVKRSTTSPINTDPVIAPESACIQRKLRSPTVINTVSTTTAARPSSSRRGSNARRQPPMVRTISTAAAARIAAKTTDTLAVVKKLKKTKPEIIIIAPWPKLNTPDALTMTTMPSAITAYTLPSSTPEMVRCTIMLPGCSAASGCSQATTRTVTIA